MWSLSKKRNERCRIVWWTETGHQCHERLLSYLRPIEWYNLAVLHSPNQFLLPRWFLWRGRTGFPTRGGCRYHQKRESSNFSITRWFLEDDVIDALKQHDQQKILDSIQSRFHETEHAEVNVRDHGWCFRYICRWMGQGTFGLRGRRIPLPTFVGSS